MQKDGQSPETFKSPGWQASIRQGWGDDLVGKQEYPGSDPQYPGMTAHVYNPDIGGGNGNTSGSLVR